MIKSEQVKVRVSLASSRREYLPVRVSREIEINAYYGSVAMSTFLGVVGSALGKIFLNTLAFVGDTLGKGWKLAGQKYTGDAPQRKAGELTGKPRILLARALKELNGVMKNEGSSLREARLMAFAEGNKRSFYHEAYKSALAVMGRRKSLNWLESVESYSENVIEDTVKTLVDSYRR